MSMLNKRLILQTLSDHEQQLAEYGVISIGLFGSYLSNEAKEDSDIDILVDIASERKTFRNFLGLNYFLEDLLHNKVDLVTRQSLSPHIGPHILKNIEYAHFTN